MARILVTGGAGFIGSHVCEALLVRGDEVIALDNFDDFYDPTVKRGNLEAALAQERFTLVDGDIRHASDVAVSMGGGVDAIVHLAARAGVRPSFEQPLLYQDVNMGGTTVLLEACRRQPGCRFIFGSSSSVYGNNEKVPFAEGDRVDFPISPYAATKRAAELLCHAYHHVYGTSITCLRFFTVYGPRQRPDLAIHKFVRLIEAGAPVPVFGDGSMRRDFTYIDDIVDGVVRALDRCEGFNVYNLGESRPLSLSDLLEAIESTLGKRVIVDRRPVPAGDVHQTYADISRARSDLGYRPATDIDIGLARFVEWFRDPRGAERAAMAARQTDVAASPA